MLKVRKSGFLRIIPILIMFSVLSFPAYAKYGGGGGTADDPYQVATADGLMLLGDSPVDYGKHFILTADIDLSGYAGEDFNIIGERYYESGWVERPFTGVFDGNGHTVSNFSYTSTDRD